MSPFDPKRTCDEPISRLSRKIVGSQYHGSIGLLQIWSLAEDDPLQKAVNYLFTGRNDPQNAPKILNRKSCVVVVSDPKFRQPIRYYLGRFRMDTAFINKTYAGSETAYSLDVKGGEVIVEYLDPGKSTVLHGHKSAQILCREISIK
jgi:hypothetical protein